MPNGKHITVLCIVLLLCCRAGFGQKKDTLMFDAGFPSFKVDEECKSKSVRSSKPTIIKISRARLAEIKTVKELIPDIPEHCDVLCVFISIKKPDDKVFEFRNIGNEMVYASKLCTGKYILVENLATTCPTLHKANFKIVIE